MTGCPSIVLPVGKVDNLPVGMQIVCRRGDDEKLLRMAASLEEKLWAYRDDLQIFNDDDLPINRHDGWIASVKRPSIYWYDWKVKTLPGEYRRGRIEPVKQDNSSAQVGPTTVEEVEKMHEAAQEGTDARLARFMFAATSS